MSFLSLTQQARKPFAEVLPDGRKRLTRFFRPNQTSSNIPVELDYPVATPDPWSSSTDGAPTGWTGLLLTYKQMRESERGFPAPNEDSKPICEIQFEQIAATGETAVGGDDITTLTDGRAQSVNDWVQFSQTAFVPQTINVSSVTANAKTCYLFLEETEDDGTLRKIKRTYQEAGIVATDDESLEGGALLLKKITSFHTVPSTPAGYTSIGTPVQNPLGYPIYTYTFAKGNGLAAQYIASRQDGLREVTNIALGSRIAPSGVPIRDDYKQDDGYTIYTVTCMQTADGSGTVTGATQSYQRYVPFTYPGRAKAFVQTVSSQSFLDVFLSPPVETLVLATVGISYVTSGTLTVSDFWNPTEWASLNATWVGAYGVAAARNIPYNGYRTTSATPVTLTSSGFNSAIFGFNIFNGETGVITVTGGPANPDGQTYTLHAEIEPAFYDTTNGHAFYRRTAIVATIPSQPSLPV